MAKIIVFKNKRADGSAFVRLLTVLVETPGSGWQVDQKSETPLYIRFNPIGDTSTAFAHYGSPNQIFAHNSLVRQIKKLLKDFDQQVLIVIE